MRGQPSRGINGTSVKAESTVAMLNIAGDRAGMKKRPSALSMPIITTASAIIVRNGSMMRVSSVVSSNFPGIRRYSGETNHRTSSGARNHPISTHASVTTASALMTRLPRRQAAARPPPAR